MSGTGGQFGNGQFDLQPRDMAYLPGRDYVVGGPGDPNMIAGPDFEPIYEPLPDRSVSGGPPQLDLSGLIRDHRFRPIDDYPQPGGSIGGGKSGPGPVGGQPQPIMGDLGGGNGQAGNGQGLSHIKDYGPMVDEMQGYVQSMQSLIQQLNSKF